MDCFMTKGDAFFFLQYNGNALDTATKFSKFLLQPDVKDFCYFQESASASLVDGVTLTGATSAAVIKVKRVLLTGGAIGSAGTGVLFFVPISGEIVSGENLQVGGGTYCVAASARKDTPFGMTCKHALITVETNDIRVGVAGITATSSTDTPASLGLLVAKDTGVEIEGIKDVDDFNMINAVEASNATVHAVLSF